MTDVLFEFYIGNTYTRDFKIDDYSADIDEIYFSVKQNNKDKNTVLQKKLSDGGITLVDVTYGTDGQIKSRTYNITIIPDDTESLKPDFDYSFDFKIVSPGASNVDIGKTIITGTFRVLNTTTRKVNEV